MKNKNPLFFLQDIQNSLTKIFKYTENISYDDFILDDKTKDAVPYPAQRRLLLISSYTL